MLLVEIELLLGLLLAASSALSLNWAYVQEHGAAVTLPALSLRAPRRALRSLFASRAWLRGLAAEVMGFALYIAALALAPLALVQSVSAGGIAVLAYFSARRQGRRTLLRERVGVSIALIGLIALGISLSRSTGTHDAAFADVVLWLGGCGLLAVVAVALSGRYGRGVPYAIAGGTLFAMGDVAMKAAFTGGSHTIFIAAACVGYGVGTILLQISYQHAAALTAAGIASLLTNSLPILAATTIFGETIPSGPLGVLRVLAFVTLVLGASALARGGGQREAPAAAG